MKNFVKTLICVMFVTCVFGFNCNYVKAEETVSPAEKDIVAGIKNMDAKISIEKYQLSRNELFDIMDDVAYYYPELYYYSAMYAYGVKSNKVSYVRPTYEYSASEVAEMNNTLKKRTDEIVSKVTPGMTDVEKALTVYNYLAINTTYDEDEEFLSFTAYGPIVNGKGTCFGYASAFNYIMKDMLGFDCSIIISDCGEHSWNIIKINGDYYHCDVTWADPTSDVMGNVWHEYFLLSDRGMLNEREDYTWDYDKNAAGKEATNTKYDNYFWRNVTTGILNCNGNWYFVSNNKKLCKADVNTNKVTELDDLRYSIGTLTDSYGIYNKIAVVGNDLYINSSKAIYRVNIGQRITYTSVYKKPSYEWRYIYGIANIDGVLRYQFKYDSFWDSGETFSTSIKE